MMKEALIDVSVLIVFFTRHEMFRQVFEQVRKARPSELFLYQDGPREDHPEDVENIKKCREIAENVDWECKVHRLYQEKNVGVDPSGYLADTWAFSLTDKCIVLEDDVIPSISFFSFCKMMLDKYENDERIMLISGFNMEEKTVEIDASYFFSTTTFLSGAWATWLRVVRQWDAQYLFMKDANKRNQVKKYINRKSLDKSMLGLFQEHLDSGIEHFETILISNQYLHQGLTIVPRKNMANNIGLGEGSAHYTGELSLIPKGFRCFFTMKRYEMKLSEIHHPYKVEDYPLYRKNSYRICAWGHPFIKVYRHLEISWYKIKEGNIREAVQDIIKDARKVVRKINKA